MENRDFAGFQAPQSTIFDGQNFASDDKNLSVDAILGMCGAVIDIRGNLGSYFESVGSLEEDEDSRSFEDLFTMEMPKEMRDSMLGGYLYAPMSEDEKVAMDAMYAELAETFAAEAITKSLSEGCCGFVPGVLAGMALEAQANELKDCLDAIRPVLEAHFDRARRLIHRVRRNIALKRFTLKPVASPLDWLDLVVRRRRRIGATIATVDRLFSHSSCGGWSL